jgi:pSer/pThr/pTyr-binding forkhead associated (FHA) protein
VDNKSPIWFAAACGAVSSLDLVIEKDTGEVVTRGAVEQPCAMIGRDPYCEIVLADKSVSARHAFLQVVGGRVFVVDLDSRSGTRWDDLPRPDGWLTPDTPVQLGPFRIHVTAPVSDTPAIVGPTYHPLHAGPLPKGYPRVAVEFRNGKVAQGCWDINRTLTLVGRARACKINLASDEVSLFHAYFLLTPDGVWVVDLYGRGGVLVNDEPVRFRRLDHGDEVRIAKFILGISYAEGATNTRRPEPITAPLATANPDVTSGFPDRLTGPLSAPPVTLIPADDDTQATRFSAVQSQLFERFQQSMLMMMKLFGQAHREQIAAMEREMAKLAALTEELQKLQAPAADASDPTAVRNAIQSSDNTPIPADDSALNKEHIFDRISALHSERQGVWHRLMSLVSAKPTDG